MAGRFLSNDHVLDILRCLGVKDLLRFRCISKSFCSSIDDPYFTKLHLSHSLETNTNLYLISRRSRFLYINSVSDEEVLLETSQVSSRRGCQIFSSCNGLLTLFNGRDEILLWNPSTGSLKMLQLPPTQIEFPPAVLCCEFTEFGFGYDAMSNDYKFVQIIQFLGKDHCCIRSEVRVYSLKKNSWKSINGLPLDLDGGSIDDCGVLANNALHWLVSRINGLDTILALDLGDEKYGNVELPGCLDDGFNVTMKAMRGCLCLAANNKRLDTVNIWILEEYGNKESWRKLISIERSEYVPAKELVSPLALSKNGNKILLNISNKQVFWYDISSKTIDMVLGGQQKYEIELMAQSLVPLQ